MSVLLNIAMPKTCEVCPCNDDNWRCGATREYFDYDDMCERRRADCPLIEIPTPHGRLIDADELKTAFPTCDNSKDIKVASVRATINHMQTIIEAERSEE
jgi:hypothetical protein